MNREIAKRRAIYGVAIGDAVGVPYEFKVRGTFTCNDMDGYGTHNKPPGTWSDDTSMTLATAESIQCCGGINVGDMLDRFRAWYYHGSYTVDGLFDVGNTTSVAIRSGRPGRTVADNGNGSLMRIIPLAFTDCTDDEIRAVSAITHGHTISQEACVIYVHIARALMQEVPLEDAIDALKLEEPFDRLRILRSLNEDEIMSGGYVVDTLEAALWCVMHNDNYKDTILAAVNLGFDTDTTAAVAGGLAGIIHGVTNVWYTKLRGKAIIESVLEEVE